jgi:hypothetical protein
MSAIPFPRRFATKTGGLLLLAAGVGASLTTMRDLSAADRTFSGNQRRPPFIGLAPILGHYSDQSILLRANVTVMPDAAPVNTASMSVFSSTSFQGELVGEPSTGVVRVTNAHPAGTYTITVQAFSSSGESATTAFSLIVTSAGLCNPVTFVEPGNARVYTYPWNIAVGDFNGDGKQDLVVTHAYAYFFSILLGDGRNHFAPPRSFNVGYHPYNIVVGDFNGDGKQDLAIINNDASYLSISFGDGTGNFDYLATSITVGAYPRGLAMGDFNGDGKQDLATTKLGNINNVGILLGDGAGHFSAAPSLTAGADAFSVAVGDFNRDDEQDLAVGNEASDDVSILLGNGMGGFTRSANFPAGTRPRKVLIGDFNGDGIQDLAVLHDDSISNPDRKNISILLGNGMGGFSAAQSVATGDDARDFTVADLNGDNNQDLVVVHTYDDYVSLLSGDGMGHFSIASAYPTGSFPNSPAVGDFNGDGKQDLAVTVFGDDEILILLGNCNDCNLCHKHATTIGNLTCGTPEYQRHLDHGDSIGACPPGK